jgi:NADPH:quinone reductase-like Zn-dependent oxidoreductase
MRALVADASASPALSLADVPEPTPGPGQLLLAMEAASVNRGEVRTAAKQPPGTVIGWDVAGTVAALGEGVTSFDVGERVVALSPSGGAFAEQVVVPAEWAAPLPSACDFVTAAALPVAGVTAVGILRLARIHAGDRVLITGAAGGVGLFAVQLAVQAKATVTGQAGSGSGRPRSAPPGPRPSSTPATAPPSRASSTRSWTASAAPCWARCWTPPRPAAGW